MSLSKHTQLKHNKMIAEAEDNIRKGRIHSQLEVEKIIQSWKKEDFETDKSLIEELEVGEKSGFADAVENLKKLHEKHLTKSK